MRTRRFLAATLVSCLVAALLSAPGSAAATVEWTDPKGDANGLPRMESSPRPSDPELDILSASFSRKGDSLVASMKLDRVGVVNGSFGSVYRWYFKLKDSEYFFMARTATAEYSQLGYLSTPRFVRAHPSGVSDLDEQLKCDCKATFDDKTKTVAFAIKWEGIKKTLKGGELKGLYAITFRRYPYFIPGDTARAPEKASFAL